SSFGFAAAIIGLLEAAMLSQPASMAIARPERVAVPAPRTKLRRVVETSFKRRILEVMTAPSGSGAPVPKGHGAADGVAGSLRRRDLRASQSVFTDGAGVWMQRHPPGACRRTHRCAGGESQLSSASTLPWNSTGP